MKLFLDENILEFNTLREEESFHCAKVLRLKSKDLIFITDGNGNLYKAVIDEINPKKTTVEIIETYKEYGKRPYYTHIAIAPTKNIDRFEWFIEKCTEIGIDEITPIICKNSERKVVKNDRLNKIAESAMKQSYKAYYPKINELVTFNNFISKSQSNIKKYIAHCNEENKDFLGEIITKYSNYLILIGPEGDFSEEEIILSKQHSFSPISLGNSRLRTETAGIVACNIIATINLLA